MLDKNIQYIKIEEKLIESKQTSGGLWYCSSVSAKTTDEMDQLINKLNQIYNKYNAPIKKKKEKKVSPAPPSIEKQNVKGLE